jgi:hypothetical protein
MIESKRVDGIIYLACVDKELVCYESNHRREALDELADVHHILVDILWDATDEMVKAEFLRLNKAVSVPELFVEETNVVDVDGLLEIRDRFCSAFKSNKTTTQHPQRPNFNPDGLLNEFNRIMKENKIGPNELWSRLMRLNEVMSNRDRSKLSPKIIEKCEKSQCWLFAWSRTLDAKELV